MRGKLFLLSILSAGMPTQAYIMSYSSWKLPNGSQVVVLGDAHAAGTRGEMHAQVLESRIDRWASADKKTVILLEAWEDFPAHDYLYELQIFQDAQLNKNNTLLAIRHKFYTCRQQGMVDVLFCDRRNATLISCFDVLNGSWKYNSGAVSLLKQLEHDEWSYNAFINSFEQSTYQARQDMMCLSAVEYDIAKKYIDTIDYQVCRISEFFSRMRNKPLMSSLEELARTRLINQNLEYIVADVGFITELFKQKEQYERIVIFVGYLHALSINKALYELKAHAIVKVGLTERFAHNYEGLDTSRLTQLLNVCFNG